MEPLIKKNNSYTFNDKEISDILKETHFDKKAGSFDNIMVHWEGFSQAFFTTVIQ